MASIPGRPDIIPQPGMVLCVRTNGFAGEMIRFGEMLIGEDDLENHVLVLDHIDNHDTWWGIEGRPGGVGWRDATAYLNSEWTLSNQGQRLTFNQRESICKSMRGLLGVPYDWTAITEDALRDLHLPDLWGEKWHSQAPAHVVCSSLAAWAYFSNRLPAPGSIIDQPRIDPAHVQPADWADFIMRNRYQFPPMAPVGPTTPADGIPQTPAVVQPE